MWWVRLFCVLIPVAIVAGAMWLWGELGKLSVETPTALVVAVREDPGALNPLQPSSGFQREITDLVFEKLFRRDDEMLMRGHLAERWELRQRVSFFFRDAAGATAALAELEALREAKDERWLRWGVSSLEQKGDALELVLGNHEFAGAEAIDALFDDETRLSLTQIQLRVKDSAKQSFDLFRRDAVEKDQVRHVVFDEANQTGVISAAGEVDLLQRELELFYQANETLQPSLEVLGTARFVVEPEVLLHLREGITWHDGTAFSADDVVYSYREVARPGSGSVSALKPWFASVISVQALEPRVVGVTLREPYAPLMESWEALPILPAHLLAGAAAASAAERTAFFAQPIGTGPYRVASRQPGKSLTLHAFEHYFRGAAMQAEIRYEVIADHAARAVGFRLRQIDVLRPDDVERVVMRGDDRVEEIDGVPRTQSFVAWNLRREPFLDGRVRTALAHMIDVRELVETAAGPESQVCRGIFYPKLWLCPDEVDVAEFDVEKAHAILAEAGWSMVAGGGGGGESESEWLRNADGETLSFRLLVDAGNLEHLDVATTLVSAWRGAGVRAVVETRSWLEMISEALEARDFDAMLLSWELGFRRDQSQLWHSSQTDAAAGGGNFSGLRNQIVDDLLDQLKTETDPPAVQSLAVELQSLLWALKPCLFLYESGEVVMARRGVLREQRPLMDGRRSDQAVIAPPAGLAVSRPWWVKRELAEEVEADSGEALPPSNKGGPDA